MPAYQASDVLEKLYADQVGGKPMSVIRSLYGLAPQPDKFIFLENNSVDNTLLKLAKFERPKEIIRLWFREDAMDYVEKTWHPGEPIISARYDLIGICRQLLLQRARNLDPDYAIFLDSDIVVLSEDLISRLCKWENADIVGAPYVRDFQQGRLVSALWANPHPTPEYPFQLLSRDMIPNRLTEVLAIGGGCMRLSREVIQEKALSFYPVQRPWLGVGPLAEDFGYCLNAREFGFKICLDPTVKLAHLPSTSAQLGTIAWTTDQHGDLIRFSYAS
jgi:glycosyltransferase involved in cell wall biosynthesis